jgi:Fe-S-cluster containining protein
MKKSEYLNVCQKCKASCCKLGGTNLTKKEVDRILDKGHKNHFIVVKEGVYELKSKKNGVCPYLKEDFSCKIHDVKPLICTCWPIFPEYDEKRKKINHELINCPLTKKMKKEEIFKCKKESLCVSLDVAQSAADETLTPIHQLAIIKKRYKDIEESDLD